MKVNRSNSSLPEKARQIFEQLDRCVEEARDVERTEDTERTEAKVKADQEAKRLDYLTGFGQTTMVIANSVGVLSGIASQNWILVFISAAGVISAIIGLYVWHRQE